MQDDDLDHLNVTERDVDSLAVVWKSAGAADDVEHAEFVWKLVQFLRHVARTNENPINVCPILGLQPMMTTGTKVF